MTDNTQQVVEIAPTDDLPEAPPAGSLGALRQYITRPEVAKRLTFACGGDERKMLAVAAGLYSAVETSEDPGALLACSPRSIVNAALLAMQLNLPLDGRKLAFLTPRKNKHRNEMCALLTPSYHGFEYVVRQRYPDFEGRAEFKFKDDEFKIVREGGLETYRHVPANPFCSDYRSAEGLFYHYTFTDDNGKLQSVVYTLPMSEVLKSEKAAPKKEVWSLWFRPQAKKTIIRSALSSKFKTIVQPIEELDNQHFDLNSEELKKDGVFKVSRIQAVVEADLKKRGLPPIAEEAIASTESIEPGEGHSDVATAADNASPAPQEEPEGLHGEIIEGESEEVLSSHEPAPAGWDGAEVVMPDGRIVSRQWKSPSHAGAYLAASLATVTSAEEKEQIAEQNEALLDAIKASGNEDLYNSLGEMLGYGETHRRLPA